MNKRHGGVTLDKEVWKDVKHYEGLYKVSNHGRVWSVHKNGYKKINTKENGYKFVQLYNNGKMRNEYIHRLVAMAFIPNLRNLPQVNHKDENKSNNCADNLEWCDKKYNANYGTAISRRVESYIRNGSNIKQSERWKKKNPSIINPKTYGKNSKSRKVVCDGIEFDCIKSCAEYYGVSYSSMRCWLSGADKTPDYFIDKKLKYL